MGAKLTNTRTGQVVNMVPPTQTPYPLLQVVVGDTVRIDWTITNIGGSSGSFTAIWATGVGDKQWTGTLNPNQSASGSGTVQYTQPMNQFTSTFSVFGPDNRIQDQLRADIVVIGQAKFRIDDPPLLQRLRTRFDERLMAIISRSST